MKATDIGNLDIDQLCSMGVHVVRQTLRVIKQDVTRDPETAFTRVLVGDDRKEALRVDVSAEDTAARTMRNWHNAKFGELEVYGEERLRNRNLDLSDSKNLCALVDAIDGTDLLERGLYNWCSTFVFFAPSRPEGCRILAAFVGLPSGEVFLARADRDGAFVTRSGGGPVLVKGPSTRGAIKDASICFYGQKLGNLMATMACGLFTRMSETPNSKGTRIYNLAGIPMMVKLVHHCVETARTIDAVFDVEGQKPHDVVPGAFIAKKAGAALVHLNGQDIQLHELENLLFKPAQNELKYVLAATKKLANSLVEKMKVQKTELKAG